MRLRALPLHGTLSLMDIKEMARLGAAATNKLLTKEGRAKAAKKGWKNRRKQLKSAPKE